MANYYERLMEERDQWEKEKPCSKVCCPRYIVEQCPTPCEVYTAWLGKDPITRAIRQAGEDIENADASMQEAKARLSMLINIRIDLTRQQE